MVERAVQQLYEAFERERSSAERDVSARVD